MVRGLKNLSYEDRVKEQGSFSLKKRGAQEELSTAYQDLMGAYKKGGDTRVNFAVTWIVTKGLFFGFFFNFRQCFLCSSTPAGTG